MGRTRMAAFTGLVAFCIVLLAGCTSESGVVTQTLESTSASPVESTPTPSTGSTAQTEPSSPTPPSSTAASSTADNPWPANLTPDQVAAAQAALATVDGYIQVSAAANADPASKDWTSEIRTYAADPAAAQTLDALASLVVAQVHQTAPPVYEHPKVISIDEYRIVVEACADNTTTNAVDGDGNSVLQPPINPRVIVSFTLRLSAPADGGWLVGEQTVSTPPRTC
jgi:hypothetical protein